MEAREGAAGRGKTGWDPDNPRDRRKRQRKEGKEGRERGMEPGCQSERSSLLEPRQIALEGYLLKHGCSARWRSS